MAYLVSLLATIAPSAQEPAWQWVRSLHTSDTESATALATDPLNGEIYVAANWKSSLAAAFPAGTIETTSLNATFGGVDGLVAKFDSSGEILWAFKVGSESDDRISDIHVYRDGSFYITGSFGAGTIQLSGNGTASADSQFLNGSAGIPYLAKYDPEGHFLWMRHGSDSDRAEGRAIASDNTGVYMTGYHMGTIHFGPLPSYNSRGGEDLFLVKYSHDGDELWHLPAGSELDDRGEDIICSGLHLYLGGRFDGTALSLVDLSGEITPLPNNSSGGQSDAFVGSFTPDGAHEWTRVIASELNDDCRGLALDGDLLFATGTFSAEARFPLYPLNPVPHKGGVDSYICALSPVDGATQWVQTLTGDSDGNQVVKDLSVDPSGSLFLTGHFTNNIASPDLISVSRGDQDIFLASFSSDGIQRWIKTAGSDGPDSGNGICAAIPSNVHIAGTYSNFTEFDSETVPGDLNLNIFVAGLDPGCVDAVGGILTVSDTQIGEGETVTFTLEGYTGEIRWEISPTGVDGWIVLTDDPSDLLSHLPTETAEYRAVVTSGSCLPDTSNVVKVEVLAVNERFAYAGEDVTICPGDSTLMQASGGEFFKWDPPEGLDNPEIPDPWAKPFRTTHYVVHVTRSDGLTDIDSVTVFVLPRPAVDAGGDTLICLGEEVKLSASGEGKFRWFPMEQVSDPNMRDPLAAPDSTIIFTVVITDENGCRNRDIVTVSVLPPPRVDAGPDQVLVSFFETRLEAAIGQGETGVWNLVAGSGTFQDPAAPDTRVLDMEMGENIFSWNVTNGICPEVSDLVTISVRDFLVPTVITPNGDGKNDHFHVEGIERFRSSELIVLNRWGEEIFRAAPYQNNWEGTDQKGQELPEGTYFYVLTFKKDDIRKGYVVMIR